MNDEKREIIVSAKLRQELESKWNVKTVRSALRGTVRSETTLDIREYALKNGGRYWI